MYSELIDQLEVLQNTLIQSIPRKSRLFYDTVSLDRRGTMIVGPRGVGKTSFLLALAKTKASFYFSADHPLLAAVPLYDFVEALISRGFKQVLIDEILHARDWEAHISQLYDSFPNCKILFSQSMRALKRKNRLPTHQAMSELSQRFSIQKMPFLSFREYVYFQTGEILPTFNPLAEKPATTLELSKKLNQRVNIEKLFEGYIREGLRPIFTEGAYSDRLVAIIDQIIFRDIPFHTPQLATNHFRLMRAVIGHLATSTIPAIQLNHICEHWELGKRKFYQLLDAMERTALVQVIRKKRDMHAQSVGEKVFLAEPSMYYLWGDNTKIAQQSFIATMFGEFGSMVSASDHEEGFDMLVDGVRIDIGGQSEPREGKPQRIMPLWMVGLLY